MSQKQLVDYSINDIHTVAELIQALQGLDCDASVTYVGINNDTPTTIKLRVIEETLTDGSKVRNLAVEDKDAELWKAIA